MNNSVFGRTMKNIRNRSDVRLITNEKSAENWLQNQISSV